MSKKYLVILIAIVMVAIGVDFAMDKIQETSNRYDAIWAEIEDLNK